MAPAAGLIAVDPKRQGLLEAGSAGLLAVLPNGNDDGFLRRVVGGLGTALVDVIAVGHPAVAALIACLRSQPMASLTASIIALFPARFRLE